MIKVDNCQEISTSKYKDMKKYRLQAGFSQVKLAKALGVRQATISDWETGVYFPTAENIKKMAEIFGVDIKTLKTDLEVTRAINELKRRNVPLDRILTLMNIDDLDILMAVKQLQEHNVPKEDVLCMMS